MRLDEQRNFIAQHLPLEPTFLEPNEETHYQSEGLNLRIYNATRSVLGFTIHQDEEGEPFLSVANAGGKAVGSLFKYVHREGEQLIRIEPKEIDPELPADVRMRVRDIAFQIVCPR